jgi:hypothetical protein
VGLSALLTLAGRTLPVDVPVDPSADEARDLLVEELAKQEYQAAKPTWFDMLVRSFTEWLDGLTAGGGTGGPPSVGILVVVIVIAALLLVAFLIFGLPRLNRRSTVTGALFGDDDTRSAADMRSAAEAAAAAGDYSLATTEMFRSIARGLAERTVLTTSPGTTAHDFGARAGRAFPERASALEDAAAAFDDVRYLEKEGTQSRYREIAALERALRTARPVLESVAS